MRALLDNHARPLLGRQATYVREALFGDDDVEVVLRLVNVRAHGHDAGDPCGVGFAGTRGRRVHDGVFGGAEEVSGAAEAVEHAAAHDAGGVGVSVDVHFDGGVHADDTEAADDFGGVGDLLRAEEELGRVVVPAVVETLESVGGEADGGCCCEVQVTAVKEVEEGVLKDFSPDFEVLEVCAAGLLTLIWVKLLLREHSLRDHQQRHWQCFRYLTEWARGSQAVYHA